jgi:hypothetical protein
MNGSYWKILKNIRFRLHRDATSHSKGANGLQIYLPRGQVDLSVLLTIPEAQALARFIDEHCNEQTRRRNDGMDNQSLQG